MSLAVSRVRRRATHGSDPANASRATSATRLRPPPPQAVPKWPRASRSEGGKSLTVDISEWLRLRKLLREAAEAAETVDALEDVRLDVLYDEPVPTAAPVEKSERERVVELGVTGLIVRFPDNNPVLLGAISRIQGWRPNPSGSHHVPCTLPAITSLLAFAEMYDFELTDGADSMVRQLIRDSYTTREWHRQAEAASAAGTTAPQPPPRIRIVPSQRDALVQWARRNARALVIAALVAYLLGPKVELVREADRAFLEPAQLGAEASVAAMLSALDRCGSAVVSPGAALPPGCQARVATRAGTPRLSIGIQNPRLRLFSWRLSEDPRGFAICDQAIALESCWDR